MDNTPNKKIIGSSTQHIVAGLGLSSEASEAVCSEALFHIAEGHVWLDCADDKWALVGDKSEKSHSVAAYYKTHLHDPALWTLSPRERLVRIINRFATDLDLADPTPQGVPSRMQAIWLIENEPERER